MGKGRVCNEVLMEVMRLIEKCGWMVFISIMVGKWWIFSMKLDYDLGFNLVILYVLFWRFFLVWVDLIFDNLKGNRLLWSLF